MGQSRVGDVVGPPAPKLAPQREPVVYEPPPPGTLGALAALKRQLPVRTPNGAESAEASDHDLTKS